MKLPRYFLLVGRPAKIDRMEDGRVGAYDFNLQTGEFELRPMLIDRLTKADNEDVETVSAEEFLARVEELRKEIAGRNLSNHHAE
ncbi:MAG: hypothetical protein JW730_16260 [Anaerolineales bacterium]|nr:hypothetical protein [Anaerolineales bacterium]